MSEYCSFLQNKGREQLPRARSPLYTCTIRIEGVSSVEQTYTLTDDMVSSTTQTIVKSSVSVSLPAPPGICPVDLQLAFLKVCHAQTCGECVPCRVGLGQLENLLEDVMNNRADLETLDLIERTARNIELSADCAIGSEAARLLLAGFHGFREDYISHVTEHCCTGSFEQPIPCINLCPAHVDIPGYIALVGGGPERGRGASDPER